jgi:hypothetical protein
VQGLDASQAVTWTGTESVRLDGDVSVTVDLQPVSDNNAVYYFSWTVDAATGDPGQIPGCGPGERMDQVAIFVDNLNLGSYGCEQGLNGNLVITPYVTQGQHTVQLVTYNSQENTTAFAQSEALQIDFVTGGQGGSQTVPLHWNVGGVQAAWAPYASMSDYNSDTRQSCASAGITDLVLTFQSPDGPQSFALGSSCNASVVLDNVYSGNLTPQIDACGQGTSAGTCGQTGTSPTYREDPALVNPPTLTVQAGAFFQAGNPTPFQVFIPLFHL